MEKYDLEIEFKKNEIKKIDEYAKTIFDNYLNKCKAEKELTEEKDESENSSKESKKSKKKKEIDDNELVEELNNIESKKSNKKKKNIVKKEESDSESEEDEYEKITIKEKEYIKEGKKIYKIKEGKKGKLYGIYDKKGNFEKVKSSEK